LNLDPPKPGAVIRYAYLWSDEQRRGREEARKDRPVLALAVAVRQDDGKTEVLVLAITHSPPTDAKAAVVLPAAVKRRLKLDAEASWIVTTEANAFVWPGPDLRPIPGRGSVVYGRIPDDLLAEVARSYLANRTRQRTKMIRRTR
jgi:hypothetical protein